MVRKPGKREYVHPDETNGGSRAPEIHAIVYDLIYKVGRLEGGFAIIIVLVLAILGVVIDGRIRG